MWDLFFLLVGHKKHATKEKDPRKKRNKTLGSESWGSSRRGVSAYECSSAGLGCDNGRVSCMNLISAYPPLTRPTPLTTVLSAVHMGSSSDTTASSSLITSTLLPAVRLAAAAGNQSDGAVAVRTDIQHWDTTVRCCAVLCCDDAAVLSVGQKLQLQLHCTATAKVGPAYEGGRRQTRGTEAPTPFLDTSILVVPRLLQS